MSNRILLAEDYEDARTVTALLLRSYGYECDTASNGRKAVELFTDATQRGARYDLALLDAAMPDMSGFEVTEKIREQDQKIPVLLITGYPDSLVAAHGKRVKVTKILYKPLDPDDLLREIKKAIKGEKIRVATECD